MSVQTEFSKYSSTYEDCSIIQKFACSHVFSSVKKLKPKNVLELGAGTGQFFELVDWEFDNYIAVDFSQTMCDIHPKANNLEVKCLDFDGEELREILKNTKFDCIVAPSSLQWSKDFDALMQLCEKNTKNIFLAIFTSNTFKTIHEICEINSPIKTADFYSAAAKKYFDAMVEVKKYQLKFESKKAMFEYIKKSGVSGGEKKLDFVKAKKLYKEYPLDYLEFEVLFITSFSKS